MGVLEKICERVERVERAELYEQCDKEVLNGLVTKMMQLDAIQSSVDETSKTLKEMRAFMEAKINQGQGRDRNLLISQGVGLGGMKLIQNFMAKQEKLMEQVFKKIELERKQFEATRRKTDARFTEIFLKDGHVKFVTTHNNNNNRAQLSWRLHEREINLDKRLKEIEMKEVVLASRQKELIAKESALEARAKHLDLWKELESIKQSQEKCFKKLDSMIPAPPAEEGEKSRKRFGNTAGKSWEIGDADGSRPAKRKCHVEGSSNSTEKGGTSANSDSESASGDDDSESGSGDDDSCSEEMDENQVKPPAFPMAPVKYAEQILTDACSRAKSVSNPIDYSKSLINDFEKLRRKKCFAVGQTWACYDDTKHKMPRLYVRIVEVLNSSEYSFRLRTAFLLPPEYSSQWDEVERYEGWEGWIGSGLPLGCGNLIERYEGWEDWIGSGLPLGCGNLIRGNLRVKYLYQFSHQMCCKESYRPYRIHPSRGEIWALLKYWKITTWGSSSPKHPSYIYSKYEVEYCQK